MKTIGVIGATGLTGEAFTKILLNKLGGSVAVRLFAGNSAGARIQHGSKWITVESIDAALDGKLDYAVFMTPPDVSAKYAPLLTARGITCIDNSPCFRNDKSVPLIVRQINGELISGNLIANPNCVTIQVAIALNALLPWQPKRLTVATYQSASGAGREGLADLIERRTIPHLQAFTNQIFDNVLPQIGEILPDGYTVEEHKMQDELQKIFAKKLSVNCFAARVPVSVGHCAFVNVELQQSFVLSDVIQNIKNQPNVLVLNGDNATPRILCHTKYVAIGRIVEYLPTNSVNMFVVADNLLRGAAYNAFEILEQLLEKDAVTEKTNRNARISDVRPNHNDTKAPLFDRTPPCSTDKECTQNTNSQYTEHRSAESNLHLRIKRTTINAQPKCTVITAIGTSTNGDRQSGSVRQEKQSIANKPHNHNAETPSAPTATTIHGRTNATTEPNSNTANKPTKSKLLITALATPYRNGRIDCRSLEKLVERQTVADGVVACGTTGEGHLLAESERTEILRCIKAVAPSLPMWATITQTGTSKAIRQAETATKMGASALLLCPPLFVGCSPQGFLQHVKAIRAATHLPICLYNVPHRCGYSLNKTVVQRLADDIEYIKDCTAELQMKDVADIGLLCGSDGLLQKYLAAGACGIVSVASNAAPQLSRLALEGDTDCRTLFRKIARLLDREPNPVCIKYLLKKLGIFRTDEVRLPLLGASNGTKAAIDKFICDYAEILR